jgi:enoyl-CoA hydratase/carnithine racemase
MYFSKEETLKLPNYTFAFLKMEWLDEHVFQITLNRPAKKNALHPIMVNELAFAIEYARNEKKVWCVVLAAEGDVWCSGADLKAFSGDAEIPHTDVPFCNEEIILGDLFHQLEKPCIAKVHANVFAGGFLLLTGCSHVIAVKDALFGLPEVKRGLFPFQVMAGLMEIMPARKVLDWCIGGKTKSAEQALQLGLVSEICEKEDLDASIIALCNEICEGSPTAIQLGIEAYRHLMQSTASAKHGYLREKLFECLSSENAQEGILAFKEKRKAVWKG